MYSYQWDDDVQGYVVYDNQYIVYIVNTAKEADEIVSLLKNEEVSYDPL